MSAGSESGVICILLKLPPIVSANALASVVLPRPGFPSRRMWPWLSRVTSISLMMSCLPKYLLEISSAKRLSNLGSILSPVLPAALQDCHVICRPQDLAIYILTGLCQSPQCESWKYSHRHAHEREG